MLTKERKRLSVKTKLEKTPGITERELTWAKKSCGRLIRVKSYGDKATSTFNPNKFPKAKFVIHQHLPGEKRMSSTALPSFEDFLVLSRLMLKAKAKTGVQVSTNKEGKVIGYTLFKLNKRITYKDSTALYDSLVKAEKECFGDKIHKKTLTLKDTLKIYHILKRVLEKYGYKPRQKLVPMPGYRLNKNLMVFERIRNQKRPRQKK